MTVQAKLPFLTKIVRTDWLKNGRHCRPHSTHLSFRRGRDLPAYSITFVNAILTAKQRDSRNIRSRRKSSEGPNRLIRPRIPLFEWKSFGFAKSYASSMKGKARTNLLRLS